ncbi:MAG: ParA family protein [Candidatus Latescibacterota bacterium]|nr:MAG: ParA family protein [Candidatus Latescibacterota bacterium]
MQIIALYSIKGGVGKTAAAVNFAYLSARSGARTILCDLDPQGSATYYFRIRPARRFGPRKLIKGGPKMERKIRGTDFDNLDLLPSSMAHRNLDVALASLKRSKRRLRESLYTLGEDYDVVFLDCAPSITLASENIFRAADLIVVPFVPTTLSLLAYEKLISFFDDKGLNDHRIRAFFSMAESRKRMHRDLVERMASNDTRFLRTVIPYLSDIERMGLDREPVVSSKPKSLAASRYSELWNEIDKSTRLTNGTSGRS